MMFFDMMKIIYQRYKRWRRDMRAGMRILFGYIKGGASKYENDIPTEEKIQI